MSDDEAQVEMTFEEREPRQIPESAWSRLGSEANAVKYIVDNCGMLDKVICAHTGIDPATLSKAKDESKGKGAPRIYFPELIALEKVTGIHAALHAHMLAHRFDPRQLRRFETDLERENRELREENERLKTERVVELRFLRDIKGI